MQTKMGYKYYTDNTLMNLSKKELIAHIRMLEHNWEQSKITVQRQLKLLHELEKQKKKV